MSKVLEFFDLDKPIQWRTEILAGLTVAMVMIPESMSFAILAGFPPLAGLYAAFIAGLVAALFGGRPGLISGGAGATVVTLIALIQSHGLEYAFAAIVLAGVLQVIVGIFKWNKYIRLVPGSVMYGFVNGLAVLIFSAQVNQFFTIDPSGQKVLLQGSALTTMAALVALTIVITLLFPKVTKKIPESLAAIIVVFAIVLIFGIETRTVGDISPIGGTLPPFHIPDVPLNWETFRLILPYSFLMAAVGLAEGLLTLNLVDEITETKGNGSREALAQGASNILNGFFSGMGGCPMVAPTMVNLNAGARSRVAGVVAAVTIILIVVVGAPVIERIPMAALTGVMMVVAFFTFNWRSFKILNKMPRQDVAVMIIVTAYTIIFHDLAVAVLIGIIVSALSFAWKKALGIQVQAQVQADGSKRYMLHGDLFFGSIADVEKVLDIHDDPDRVVFDFQHSCISDMDALEFLNKMTRKYREADKSLVVENLDEPSQALVQKAAELSTLQLA